MERNNWGGSMMFSCWPATQMAHPFALWKITLKEEKNKNKQKTQKQIFFLYRNAFAAAVHVAGGKYTRRSGSPRDMFTDG